MKILGYIVSFEKNGKLVKVLVTLELFNDIENAIRWVKEVYGDSIVIFNISSIQSDMIKEL